PDHDVVNSGTLYFRDGAVRTIERTAGTRARDARCGAASARAITHAQVARSARRLGTAIQSANVGFSRFWLGGSAPAPFVAGIFRPPTERGACGYALRHALEPVRQPLGRRARHRTHARSEVAAGGAPRDGPRRAGLHFEPAARGF